MRRPSPASQPKGRSRPFDVAVGVVRSLKSVSASKTAQERGRECLCLTPRDSDGRPSGSSEAIVSAVTAPALRAITRQDKRLVPVPDTGQPVGDERRTGSAQTSVWTIGETTVSRCAFRIRDEVSFPRLRVGYGGARWSSAVEVDPDRPARSPGASRWRLCFDPPPPVARRPDAERLGTRRSSHRPS